MSLRLGIFHISVWTWVREFCEIVKVVVARAQKKGSTALTAYAFAVSHPLLPDMRPRSLLLNDFF